MGKNFYDGTDAELYTGSAIFAAAISQSPVPLGLTPAIATSYSAVNGIYQTAYEASIDPTTRTKGTIAAKNTAKANLKKAAADVAKIINGTPTVTNQQKIDLGLNVRKAAQPHPPMTVRPVLTVTGTEVRTVSLNIHDTDGKTKRSRPAGATSAYFYAYVGASYPSDPSLWQFLGGSTKSSFTFTFPDTVASGSQVWICAAWVNGKGAGPVCLPVSTFIQGSGMQPPVGMKMAA